MQVVVFGTTKRHERRILQAFVCGVRAAGDEVLVLAKDDEVPGDVDAALVFGVKSIRTWRTMRDRGVRLIYGDKGYSRQDQGWRYIRFCWDDTQPHAYLARATESSDRWSQLRVKVKPWRKSNPTDRILIAGSSLKFHQWHDLPDPTTYARAVVSCLKNCGRQIVYRPKVSWRGAVPIKGTVFSPGKRTIEQELQTAHCLITYGSNAGLDALIAGVPTIALGPTVVRQLSSTNLGYIDGPVRCSQERRMQFLYNLAWCQWTLDELRTGQAWHKLREQAECT